MVELLNLEGEYVSCDRSGGRPGRNSKEDSERLLSLQRRGLIEDLEKQDYNLVVETAIERLHGGLRLDLSEPRGYVERSVYAIASDTMRERLEVCTMGMVASLLFSLCNKAGRPPSISFAEKNTAVLVWRGAAFRRVRTSKISNSTTTAKFVILVYCVGDSRSFPFCFPSHYVLLVEMIQQPFFHSGWCSSVVAWLLFVPLTQQPVFHTGWCSSVVAWLLFVPLTQQSVFHAGWCSSVVAWLLFVLLTRHAARLSYWVVLICCSLAALCSADSAACLSCWVVLICCSLAALCSVDSICSYPMTPA